ncbi:hypothetical protein AGABI1DRAFT_124711 [Agaricus bisporus var. burnettii JB137-S8]|nr:uncharacterized protein AGABI1DRAFT_124711 [Agaricus bisporus var. burnettii JB137-S8]EKM84403.1 hypothetical protein AGABI1DRAFT_124711 [Agaricus bisporus var. burnettii JB137-S8]
MPILKSSTTCSLLCTIPDTKRWAKTQLPHENTAINVSGTFDAINRDKNQAPTSFSITVDSLSFPPRGFIATQATSQPGPSSAGTKTGFSYAHIDKKRKATDDENSKAE